MIIISKSIVFVLQNIATNVIGCDQKDVLDKTL